MSFVLLNAGNAFAQKKKKEKPLPDREAESLLYLMPVSIDGNLEEWGDSLRFSYEKQHLQFDLANDGTNLYIAMKTSDPDAQMQALRQGFNFTVNVDGKKKDGPTITFPIPDREALRSLMALPDDEKPEDIRAGILSTVKAIYISGFKDIVDGAISLQNNFGIHAKAAVDSASDALCFEAQIPLDRLYMADEKAPLAMNIKINGIIVRMVSDNSNMSPYGNSMRRRMYGGYGYPYYGNMGQGPMRREARQEPGKWIVLPLTTE
ncbi:hypothetical protein [Olivibacter sitiensis]|uniref:hypothetical protein n=1 Tax=Olivibacter sitiensis TaxID=376470 RepID=UPI00048468C4|nr:hypothetical protein [Olivibacter sitiensis]